MKNLILVASPLITLNIFATEPCCQKKSDIEILLEKSDTLVKMSSDQVIKYFLETAEKEKTILDSYVKNLDDRLKKVAVSTNRVITNCGVETMRKIELVLECRKLVEFKKTTQYRLERLDKWSNSFKAKHAAKEKINPIQDAPPCASSLEMEGLKEIEKFSPKLHKYWVECRKSI